MTTITFENSLSTSTSSSNDMGSGPASSCQVCGRSTLITPGKRVTGDQSVIICEACKKFSTRYRGKMDNETCSCVGSVTGNINNCRLCRFKRCEAALAGVAQRQPSTEKVDFSKLPCAVCGVSSSGLHFGVISCEGCKGFFRRSVNKDFKIQYSCKAVQKGMDLASGEELCPASSNCRKCRFQRCLNAGMTMDDVANGRHTLRRRAKVNAAIRTQNNFLNDKIIRRKSAASEKEDRFTPGSSHCAPGSALASTSDTGDETDSDKSRQCDSGKDIDTEASSSFIGRFTKPHMLELALAYDKNVNRSLDDFLKKSSDWHIERAVEASARLVGISKARIIVDHETTMAQLITAMVTTISDVYMKCVSDFIIALPGTNEIALPDRVLLFVQAFYPIFFAQLSLDFDVEKQLPNNASLDRESAAWELSAKYFPTIHFATESFLIEAGNRFAAVVKNLQEFSLLCVLLLYNPATPNLGNVEMIRKLRQQYELALLHYFSKSATVNSEQRLADFYQLLPFFRQGTVLAQSVFQEVGNNRPVYSQYWTPIFTQLESQIVNLLSPSN